MFVLSLIYSICSSTCYLFMSKFLYIAHTPNSLFLKITYRKPKTTTVKKITVLLLSFSIFFLHLEQKCSHFHVYNCVCFIYLYNYFTTPLSGNLWWQGDCIVRISCWLLNFLFCLGKAMMSILNREKISLLVFFRWEGAKMPCSIVS